MTQSSLDDDEVKILDVVSNSQPLHSELDALDHLATTQRKPTSKKTRSIPYKF